MADATQHHMLGTESVMPHGKMLDPKRLITKLAPSKPAIVRVSLIAQTNHQSNSTVAEYMQVKPATKYTVSQRHLDRLRYQARLSIPSHQVDRRH